MGIQTAAVLYPVNTTTVDTGTGIDIRLLDSAQAAATDTTQTATATHTQDNLTRIFDPATAGSTSGAAFVLDRKGWALRLTEDMTPSDDTNCNAATTAGTLTVNVSVAINQSGGTYVAGNYGPEWHAQMFRYDPATDTGANIGSLGFNGATTWNYTPATGDLGTFKTVAISIASSTLVEFAQGEILLLQLGLNTAAIPTPTLGTATWTYTLAVDDPNTNITWASGQGVRQVCFTTGAATGLGDAAGVPVIVLPSLGAATGLGTATAALQADANMVGAATGLGTASGALQADAEMTGAAAGLATVTGVPVVIVPTTGLVEIGAGGVLIQPVFNVSD